MFAVLKSVRGGGWGGGDSTILVEKLMYVHNVRLYLLFGKAVDYFRNLVLASCNGCGKAGSSLADPIGGGKQIGRAHV